MCVYIYIYVYIYVYVYMYVHIIQLLGHLPVLIGFQTGSGEPFLFCRSAINSHDNAIIMP